MSMDFTKGAYRPNRTDNKFRTSYSLMSQWMNRKGSGQAYKREPLPATFTIAMQGNAAFPPRRTPVNSAGAPGPYRSMQVDAQEAAIDENVPIHLRYSESAGYDDFHKAYQQVSKQWPSTSYPTFGPPRLRHGRAGGSWRHVKEVLQAGGSRTVFVDGVVRLEDNTRMDEIPGGHLIQPQMGEIKSRHFTPRQDLRPSVASASRGMDVEALAVRDFHRPSPVMWRSKTDLPDFTARGKSGL